MNGGGGTHVSSVTGQRPPQRPGDALPLSTATTKKHASLNRSVLDLEVLASSDDEQDLQPGALPRVVKSPQHPGRRSSWLNETQRKLNRQASYGGGESFAPSSSTPTVLPEGSPWSPGGASAGMSHSSTGSFPWGNGIWNTDVQRTSNSRMSEVSPSPTSRAPVGFSREKQATPPLRRDSSSDGAIPFAIPLHPTLKTYRSQSYSVGQLEQEVANNQSRHSAQPSHAGRTRAGSSYGGLQRRSSRPTILGEFSPDTSTLGQLREVDDDDEMSITSSEAGFRLSQTQSRTIEKLAMENALLRQQALIRRSSQSSAQSGAQIPQEEPPFHADARLPQTNDTVLEEADGVLLNTTRDQFAQDNYQPLTSPAPASDQFIEKFKRGHWQSSLGFSGVAEPPQSRRHSFADVPIRHPSAGSKTDSQKLLSSGDASIPPGLRQDGSRSPQADHSRPSDLYRPSSSSSSQPGQATKNPSRLSHVNFPYLQPAQSIYLVTFKAARAEFYYIQEGTGLEVKNGDLVIVEADRGTDLGTVAHKNVDWSSARQLKERYVAEHYNWLMMFSRQGQGSQAQGMGTTAMSSQNNMNGRLGPGDPPASLDASTSDIKPKMIKRLAQPHEIHSLREKEGNEAKAKRMCQQKVAEHHLNMEILDAEFQMDWKKLTFYYFAETYVNFNPLVTDLFKIYKTRIWMSAVNPASFAFPGIGQAQAMPNYSSDHDRAPDSRTQGLGSQLAAVDRPPESRITARPMWGDVYNTSLSTPANFDAYNPLFQPANHPARYPYQVNQGQDFSRSTYTLGRAGVPFNPVPYMAADGSHGPSYDSPEMREDSSSVLYNDSVKAIHDLSLGT